MKRGFDDTTYLQQEMDDVLQETMDRMNPRAAKTPRTEYQCAFKVLGPDCLVSAVLGTKGAGIQDLQTTTSTKISISSREERFPGTNNRVILMRGHDNNSVDAVLHTIVSHLKDLVTNDGMKNDEEKMEMVSQKGDLKLRIVMPKAATSAMIGVKGATITRIRESTQCNIHVEDMKIGRGDLSEQIVSLMGGAESILACLNQLNTLVQECSSEAFFQNWAQVRCNMDGQGAVVKGGGKGSTRTTATSVQGGRGGPGMRMDNQHPLGRGVPAGSSYPQQQHHHQHDSVLNKILGSMPPDALHRTFAVQASLPVDSMSALIGKGGNHIKEILNTTGAKVTLRDENPNTLVTVEGKLEGMIGGYLMVMKKYLEIEPTLQAKQG